MAEDGQDLRSVEARLHALAPDIAWPPTPELWPAVRPRLRRRPAWRPIVLLAAAVLALLGGTEAAVAAYRAFHGATIERVQKPPSPSPRPPGDAGVRYDLGDRYATVSEGARVAGFTPLVPGALGMPDSVYWQPQPGVLTLVYRPRPGLPAVGGDPEVGALVMETRGEVDRASFGKLVGPGTTVQEVTVNGGPGFWISGAPHGFFFYSGGGTDRFRASADVLIWDQGPLAVRIESGLDRAGAQTLVGTMVPAAV
ncbi:MAG: hypothetical protein M3024_04120 [Candidatus Dormibacteraeota bacterium]|nr:hypothetical protein [Candidatus Dormibacteraeota bacterium]